MSEASSQQPARLVDPKQYLAAHPQLASLDEQSAAWTAAREQIADFVRTSRSFEGMLSGLNLLLLGLSIAK